MFTTHFLVLITEDLTLSLVPSGAVVPNVACKVPVDSEISEYFRKRPARN